MTLVNSYLQILNLKVNVTVVSSLKYKANLKNIFKLIYTATAFCTYIHTNKQTNKQKKAKELILSVTHVNRHDLHYKHSFHALWNAMSSYLLIYGLFSKALGSLDYTVSNDWMFNE
jgi:hypothetical protein